MDFLTLFDGLFDVTSRSLAARHLRERRIRHRRLMDSLTSSNNLEERLDVLQSWIEARQQLREKQEKIADETNDVAEFHRSMSRVLRSVAEDENRVLGDMEAVSNQARRDNVLPIQTKKEELTYA